MVAVVSVDPLKAVVGEVLGPQCRGGLVQRVEVTDQVLDTGVVGVLQQPPVQGVVGVPLNALTKLLTHEQQLLAGVRPHVSVQGAQVGALLPVVTGHLGDQ